MNVGAADQPLPRELHVVCGKGVMRHPRKVALMSLHTARLFPHQSCDGAVDIDPTRARFGAAV